MISAQTSAVEISRPWTQDATVDEELLIRATVSALMETEDKILDRSGKETAEIFQAFVKGYPRSIWTLVPELPLSVRTSIKEKCQQLLRTRRSRKQTQGMGKVIPFPLRPELRDTGS